ncbi:hypothetical protein KIW84_071125 [Lathyrus oleraceus]|uniref:Uncharacterized protein n=1 Tax=Pisum sativum TaxID=3888 RepID=A0A9D4VI81_PEA|nr:hypothetical protein KIW84_071125 [Pisum sativum]
MTIEDEQSRSNFKQLLTYFLIEQFVLCSLDPKKPRVASWGMVEKMNALEEVNWAKVIFDNTCDSFRKLKNEIDKGDGKQHYFYGCAPAFEAIVFRRIESLRPEPYLGFVYLPIEMYKAKRKNWKALELVEASEIIPCQWCVAAETEDESLTEDVGDGVEGDASHSPSFLIPANVAEDLLVSGVSTQSPPPPPEIGQSSSASPPQSPPPPPEIGIRRSSRRITGAATVLTGAVTVLTGAVTVLTGASILTTMSTWLVCFKTIPYLLCSLHVVHVQDLNSGKMIGSAKESGGLYYFDMDMHNMNPF